MRKELLVEGKEEKEENKEKEEKEKRKEEKEKRKEIEVISKKKGGRRVWTRPFFLSFLWKYDMDVPLPQSLKFCPSPTRHTTPWFAYFLY